MHDQTPMFVFVLLAVMVAVVIPLLAFAALTFYADTRRLYANSASDSFWTVIYNMTHTHKA